MMAMEPAGSLGWTVPGSGGAWGSCFWREKVGWMGLVRVGSMRDMVRGGLVLMAGLVIFLSFVSGF